MKNIVIYILSFIIDWGLQLVYVRDALDSGLKATTANFFGFFHGSRTDCGCISSKHQIILAFLPIFSNSFFDKTTLSCCLL